MNEIEDALNINPVPVNSGKTQELMNFDKNKTEIENDLDTVRDNTYNVIMLSQQAIQDMMVIAQQSQQIKAYETLNGLLKTYADINMNVLEIQTKAQRLLNKKEEKPGTVNQNLIFTGSTQDLLDLLNKKND